MAQNSWTQADLEECSYPSLELTDHTLDDNGLERLCPLDNGRYTSLAQFDLGDLEKLPLELLSAVLHDIDLQSLTDFRRVNRRAMEVLDSVPQYQTIIRYAPNTIRGALSIGSAKFISCQTLYNKLCTANCDSCGCFGGYLYLITCRRVCYTCMTTKTSYLPLQRVDAVRKFGLNSHSLATIPQIRSRPGWYSFRVKKSHTRITLFDHDSAWSAGIALHGTISGMQKFASETALQRLMDFRRKESEFIASLGKTKKPRQPRTEDAFDKKTGNPFRFMAIVSAPYYDIWTRSSEWGFYCKGCGDENDGPELNWRRRWTMDTFVDHMTKWGDIDDGYHCLAMV